MNEDTNGNILTWVIMLKAIEIPTFESLNYAKNYRKNNKCYGYSNNIILVYLADSNNSNLRSRDGVDRGFCLNFHFQFC